MPYCNPQYVPIPHPRTARFTAFHKFWPYYLGEHANRTCRRLHVAGTTAVVAVAATALATQQLRLLLALPVIGYGAAWMGHFFFEHNRPATFRYPLWSLAADFKLWAEVVTGRRAF